MMVGFLAVAIARVALGCGPPPESSSGSPHRCTKDADCSTQQYCTDAKICRTDCFADEDCVRATSISDQCNAHGRCVGAAFEAGGIDPETDAGPSDAPIPGKDVGPPPDVEDAGPS